MWRGPHLPSGLLLRGRRPLPWSTGTWLHRWDAVRSRPALRFRDLCLRRHVVPERMLQRRDVRARHLSERLRQRRRSVYDVPVVRYLRRRGMQQLRMPGWLLQRDEMQRAFCVYVRCGRQGMHGVQRDLRRRMLPARGMHVRWAGRLRRRTEVRRRPLRMRWNVVSGMLRRKGLQTELRRDLRNQRRHVCGLRHAPGRQLLVGRRLSMRSERSLQQRPALRPGRMRVRRDVLSWWLLQRHGVHPAIAEHLRSAGGHLRRV